MHFLSVSKAPNSPPHPLHTNGRWLPAITLIVLLKDFDTIPHEILLPKMKCKGFSETVVKWFKPYLTFLFHPTIFYSVPCTRTFAYQEVRNVRIKRKHWEEKGSFSVKTTNFLKGLHLTVFKAL